MEASRRIRAAVPIHNQSVAAHSDHFCDLIDDDGRLVLVMADIDVLGTSKPGLIVKQDFAGRTWVEHGVDVREVHVARDRIYHYRLSGGVRRSRFGAGAGWLAAGRNSPLLGRAGVGG